MFSRLKVIVKVFFPRVGLSINIIAALHIAAGGRAANLVLASVGVAACCRCCCLLDRYCSVILFFRDTRGVDAFPMPFASFTADFLSFAPPFTPLPHAPPTPSPHPAGHLASGDFAKVHPHHHDGGKTLPSTQLSPVRIPRHRCDEFWLQRRPDTLGSRVVNCTPATSPPLFRTLNVAEKRGASEHGRLSLAGIGVAILCCSRIRRLVVLVVV